MDQAFSCHRNEMPMIWGLGTLAAAELLIVHLLVSMWSGAAAWALTALTIAAVAQAAWMIRAMITRPVLVGATDVTVRFRTRTPIVVPIDAIDRVEDSALAPAPRGDGVFRGTLLAHPNVTLRIEPPIRHDGRRIDAIALRIDTPEEFRAAIEARREW